jgi:hypothetical protein
MTVNLKVYTTQDQHNASGAYQGPYTAANQVTPGAESA